MDTISSGIRMTNHHSFNGQRAPRDRGDDPVMNPDGVDISSGVLAHKKICIDPGHGGKDPGAIGPTKFNEKEANLEIALDLKKYLEGKGAQVVMTRETDVSLTPEASGATELAARVKVANDSKADIFLSIHNNSNTNTAATGTETYYYTQGSAASKVLARTVFDKVVEKTGLRPRGSFPANFYVIKYTDMPAMLSETAFISNSAEEAKLKDPAFRHTVAEAMGEGVEAYFARAGAENIDLEKPAIPDDGTWEPLPCERYVTAGV